MPDNITDQNGMISISGSVEGIIYSNDENGYTICDISTGDSDIITAVGYLPYISEGDNVVMYGKWVHNPKYGRQFSVENYEKSMPVDRDAILRYLSSRTIKGIGPKTARRIVDEFGEDTFDVIGNHPDWLAKISGITPKRAREISEEFHEKSGMRESMMFFREYFGAALTVRIYKKFGAHSVDIAKSNPYRLCGEVEGIGFEKADGMAFSMGLSKNSPERIDAGVVYTLTVNERQNGHTCLPKDKLVAATAQLLGVGSDETEAALTRLIKDEKIRYTVVRGTKYIYTPQTYEDETYIASQLVKLDRLCATLSLQDADRLIEKAEKQNGIRYAELQRRAICDALSSGITVITGGPGTGKTTVVRALLQIYESMDVETALAAPTGRAAKRLSEATSHEAKTIHRLLETGYSEDDGKSVFSRDENDPLDEDAVIVDEASMIDNQLMCALLRAIRPGARLVIIGDADQLPSVGAGNVLRDIIDSERFSTVKLTEIFRQAKQSLIVTNAHAINNGIIPELGRSDSDFFFLPRNSDREIARTIVELCQVRLPKAYGEDTRQGIQVICPSRRGEAGTENLNVLLQNALNPPAEGKREHIFRDTVFRVGDRVMQTRNNYDIEWERGKSKGSGIFNGDIGIITSIGRASMDIEFDDDRTVGYEFELLEDLVPAYAITVHKSQGSEYRTVIIPACTAAPMLLIRNLLYTAVTRAQTRAIIVGRRDIVAQMVENARQTMRYTGLSVRLSDKK